MDYFMNYLLQFYLSNKDWIDLFRDILFFIGGLSLLRGVSKHIKFLRERRLADKTAAIRSDLDFREKLKEPLWEHVKEHCEEGLKDIGIRFVYWKNYPYGSTTGADYDGFKEHLSVEYYKDKPHDNSWLNNTGVYFIYHLWFWEQSIYIGENKIFFFDKKGKNFEGFNEYSDCVAVYHLPFSNIVNFDFSERIEYEPIFYIKYKYTNIRKLYSNQIGIRSKKGEFLDIGLSELNLKNKMKKYAKWRYVYFKFRLYLYSLFYKLQKSYHRH